MQQNRLRFWHVDAFATQPFSGNPAAVFILDNPIDDALMQKIAAEMNQSETAFILKRAHEEPLLRWFTPALEIDLCGHATLAAAHIYMTKIDKNLDHVMFDTLQAGILTVRKSAASYIMNFPSRAAHEISLADVPAHVTMALQTSKPPIQAFKGRDLTLVYQNAIDIHKVNPDFDALSKHDTYICITSRSTVSDYDFVSRFFCPNEPIKEDPVTGSAHCLLAPFWSDIIGKKKLRAYQASKRGCYIDLDVIDDRVYISGSAVTLIEGTMSLGG